MEHDMGRYNSDNIWSWTFPLMGRLHFVRDTAGIIQISFIIWYWVYGSSVTLWFIILPRYTEGLVSIVFIFIYCIASIMTICSLARASTTNPGRVPLVPEEVITEEQLNWTHCKVCLRRRPLRSHHCRRCKQCVLKMDHHCPWINNCVGEENHFLFLQLCFWALILSTLTFIECLLHFYVYPKCTVCDYSESWLFSHERAFLYVDTTLGFLMSLFMFCMLCTQVMGLLLNGWFQHERKFLYLNTTLGVLMSLFMFCMLVQHSLLLMLDRTTFENMYDPFPTEMPRQKQPTLEIFADVCGPGRRVFWLFPCRRRRSSPVYLYPNLV